MQRLDRLLVRVERGAILLLFGALVAAQLAEIVLRNLGRPGSAVLFALTPAMVLALSLAGATLALRDGRHIRISFLTRWLPPPAQRWARRSGTLLSLGIAALLLVAACGFVRTEIGLFGAKRASVLIYPLFFALLGLRTLLQGHRRAAGAACQDRPEP